MINDNNSNYNNYNNSNNSNDNITTMINNNIKDNDSNSSKKIYDKSVSVENGGRGYANMQSKWTTMIMSIVKTHINIGL